MNLWTLPARRGLIVLLPDRRKLMEAILVAIGAVALAEIGDKTQLLAFLLASRFKKPDYSWHFGRDDLQPLSCQRARRMDYPRLQP